MKKVLIGLSGGVDSSVAAFLLKNQGYDVTGVTLNMFAPQALARPELYRDASLDAEKCAKLIGIDFLRLDVSDTFKKYVTDDFILQYLKGATPNPCVVCNIHVKFGAMLDFAQNNGFDYVATGHYAQIVQNNGRFLLKRPDVIEKEQTYVLWGLSQYQLAHALFPIANLQKEQVRKIASSINLPVSEKKDSQDICFVPDKKYADFIQKHCSNQIHSGNFIDENGVVLGKHSGIINYTLGQRKGLGISLGKPAYVTCKNAFENTVTLSDEASLFCDEFFIEKTNWIMFDNPPWCLSAFVKTRYSQRQSECKVEKCENGLFKVKCAEKIRAVTPGQSAVFYDENGYVLGGGIICGNQNALDTNTKKV